MGCVVVVAALKRTETSRAELSIPVRSSGCHKYDLVASFTI